jgi:hypothetical protein
MTYAPDSFGQFMGTTLPFSKWLTLPDFDLTAQQALAIGTCLGICAALTETAATADAAVKYLDYM